jgi:uncharacterized protein (DUF305 family)
MKHHFVMRSVLSAVLLCTAGAVIAADPPASSHAGYSMATGSSGGEASTSSKSASTQMHQTMMDGMKAMHSMQPTGDADKDFAMMMEHHHAQAVKMTQAYLKAAKDQRLKTWAQKTLDGQQKELKELRALNVTGSSTRQAEAPKR